MAADEQFPHPAPTYTVASRHSLYNEHVQYNTLKDNSLVHIGVIVPITS